MHPAVSLGRNQLITEASKQRFTLLPRHWVKAGARRCINICSTNLSIQKSKDATELSRYRTMQASDSIVDLVTEKSGTLQMSDSNSTGSGTLCGWSVVFKLVKQHYQIPKNRLQKVEQDRLHGGQTFPVYGADKVQPIGLLVSPKARP